jgi:hypothetical protein
MRSGPTAERWARHEAQLRAADAWIPVRKDRALRTTERRLQRKPGLLRAPWLQLWLVLMAGPTSQILVAIDLERLAVYGFSAVIAACCFEVEYAVERLRVVRWVLWLPILAAQTYWWLPYAGWRDPHEGFPTLTVLDLPYQVLTLTIAASIGGIAVVMSIRAHRNAARVTPTRV